MDKVNLSTPIDEQPQPQPPPHPIKSSWWLKIVIAGGLAAIAIFVGLQYWQYRNKPFKSCGGDWSYSVKCPIGTLCNTESDLKGGLAGGFCEPYLRKFFDSIPSLRNGMVGTDQIIITPTPTPTPPLVGTYINQQYGVSFRYPAGWSIVQRDIEKTENRGELGRPDILDLRSESNEHYSPITLLIYDNSTNLSIEKFQEELRKGPLVGDSIPLWTEFDAKILNPNGINAFYGNEKYCGTYQCRRYSWEGKGKIFALILYRDYVVAYNQIFDQILSTFKFLDQNKVDETANWKTYNGQYFSFKYPSEWAENTSKLEKAEPDNIEVVGFRINSSVFGVIYKNVSYDELSALRTDVGESRIFTVYNKEAVWNETKGAQGLPLPEGLSVINIIVKGAENTSYLIYFNGPREEFPDGLINQILSTFKFVQ